MKKRGSLNLSINAIVVLILAITMLGLGLAFMRNINGGATEEFQKTSGEIEKQMIEQMKDSNQVITLYRPKMTIKIGDDDLNYIGFKNDQQGIVNFQIKDIVCEGLNSPTHLNCANGQDVSIGWLTSATPIEGGENKVMPLKVEISTQANEGICYCTVPVTMTGDSGGDSKSTEFIIEVVV